MKNPILRAGSARWRRLSVFACSLIFCASVLSCSAEDSFGGSVESAILGLIGQTDDGLGAHAAEAIFTNNSGKNLVGVFYKNTNLRGDSLPIWISKGPNGLATNLPSNWRGKVQSIILRAGTKLTVYTHINQGGNGNIYNAPEGENLVWGNTDELFGPGKGQSYRVSVSSQTNAAAVVYSGSNYTGSMLPLWPTGHDELNNTFMGDWKDNVNSIVVNQTAVNGNVPEIELVKAPPAIDARRFVFNNVAGLNADAISEIFVHVGPPPRVCTPASYCHFPRNVTGDDGSRTCSSTNRQYTNGPTACRQLEGLSYCTQNNRCINPYTNLPIPADQNHRRLSDVGPYVDHITPANAPTPPSGWGATCLLGPDTLDSAATCEVLVHKGLRYWAFSHFDNRQAMAIAAYNSNNQLVSWQQKNGARYLWRISIDSDDRMVYFVGQADNEIGISLDTLPGQTAPPKVRLYRDANYAVLQKQFGPGEYPDFTQSPVNWDNRLSSLRVPVGYTVTLYEHANYEGESRTYHADTPWVGSFNDKASSMLITEATWERVPGFLKQISVGFGGEIWGVNSANNIYRYDGDNTWTQKPGSFKHVSVGQNNVVWAIDPNDNIRRYNSGSNTWTNIAGKLKMVEVGAGGQVWGVNSSNNVYRYNGNNTWTQVTSGLKYVSVGQNNVVWGVQTNDVIRRYNSGSNTWTTIPGLLKQVDISANGEVWGVNAGNNIYRYNGSGWDQLFHNSLKHVSIGQSGDVWGVQSNDVIQRLR